MNGIMAIQLLAGLLNHYGSGHLDYPDANMALSKVRTIIKKLSTKLKESVSGYFDSPTLVFFLVLQRAFFYSKPPLRSQSPFYSSNRRRKTV